VIPNGAGPHKASFKELEPAARSLVERLHDHWCQPFKDAKGPKNR
jgi:hypothetical protein